MRTDPVPGSDPTPQADALTTAGEDEPRSWGDAVEGNDGRLRADVPPHYA